MLASQTPGPGQYGDVDYRKKDGAPDSRVLQQGFGVSGLIRGWERVDSIPKTSLS